MLDRADPKRPTLDHYIIPLDHQTSGVDSGHGPARHVPCHHAIFQDTHSQRQNQSWSYSQLLHIYMLIMMMRN